MTTTARIVGHGEALPARVDHDALWREYFAAQYRHDPRYARVWSGTGIKTRHAVVDPRIEDVSEWGTGARMARFAVEALPLGKAAASAALADARITADEVGLFVVASCTGYTTPGLDILLARDLGMSDRVQRLHIGHMGCYAALPALGAVADFVVARQRAAVLLCVELPSLHVQPHSESVDQLVAHALFADAAAAVVVAPSTGQDGAGGLDLVDMVARTDVSAVDQMTWDVTDLGFRMGLSPKVPGVLARHVGPVVEDLLATHELTTSDIAAWAVHPGGRRIVEVVAEQLALDDTKVAASFDVLRDVGNCSSATVLLVLERAAARAALPPGSPVVAMAFGPGLTLYVALLRSAGRTVAASR
jgi:predicted naringenin-chalcone synthase